MTTKWYYVTSQKTHQEFSEADVQGLLNSNTIAADTLIWNTTMADWRPAAEVKPEWFASAGTGTGSVTTTAPIPSTATQSVPTTDSPAPGPAVATTTPPMPVTGGATDPMAMASMVSGIVAIVMVLAGCAIFPCLGFFGFAIAIPAVVTGHMALSNIKLGRAGPEGRGMAIAGLIMGYATLALLVLGILLAVLGFGFAAMSEGGNPFQ